MVWVTKQIKDATDTPIPMRVWSEAADGSGPYSFGHIGAVGDGASSIAYGGGNANAGTQRVVVADDSGGREIIFPVTLSLDTFAYNSGDVLADTQVMTNFFRIIDGTAVIDTIMIIDKDDQKAAFDLYFLQAGSSLGAENGAPNISDANAINILGYISVLSADYKDLGGVSVAFYRDVKIPVAAAAGTRDLFVAAVNGAGTPTFTASGIQLNVGAFLY